MQSYFDLFDRPEIPVKARYIENFSQMGNGYLWAVEHSTGHSGSFSLYDYIDYGAQITGQANTGAWTEVSFANDAPLKQFRQPCSCFAVTRMGCGSNLDARIGLQDETIESTNDRHWGAYNRWNWDNASDKVIFQTAQNNATGDTATDLTIDENFHSNKIFIGLTTSQSSIDGILKATRDAITPRTHGEAFQPRIMAESRANETNRRFVVSYYEVWEN